MLQRSEQLCGFAVTELLSTDELLQLTLFGGCHAYDKLSPERIIEVLGWGLEQKIPDFVAELGTEGADDIVEVGLLCCDPSDGASTRIGGPEGRELNANSGHSGGGSRSVGFNLLNGCSDPSHRDHQYRCTTTYLYQQVNIHMLG